MDSLLKIQTQQIDSLMNMHPYKKSPKKWGANVCKDGTFLGFILYTPVDTTIAPDFREALAEYSGPTVRVNSVKRNWSTKSMHYHGKAIDLELSYELVTYLVSEDGKTWLKNHDLIFYIEGRPGSKRVASYYAYEEARKYIFFNENATGDHVHIQRA